MKGEDPVLVELVNLRNRLKEGSESGQGLVDYALIICLVTVMFIVLVYLFNGGADPAFATIREFLGLAAS